MSTYQRIITIGLCILGTMATRFLPFIIFKENKKTPVFVEYLGKYLPPAVFAMLVVYCLKDVNWLSGNHGFFEAASVLATAVVHLWKKNMFISICVGTLCYIFLVNFVGA